MIRVKGLRFMFRDRFQDLGIRVKGLEFRF
jgi:hypothetical protein